MIQLGSKRVQNQQKHEPKDIQIEIQQRENFGKNEGTISYKHGHKKIYGT